MSAVVSIGQGGGEPPVLKALESSCTTTVTEVSSCGPLLVTATSYRAPASRTDPMASSPTAISAPDLLPLVDAAADPGTRIPRTPTRTTLNILRNNAIICFAGICAWLGYVSW